MEVTDYLSRSKQAKKIKLPARVILTRENLSLNDAQRIYEEGQVQLNKPQNQVLQLFVNGSLFAAGRLVSKGREVFFKIISLKGDEKGEK